MALTRSTKENIGGLLLLIAVLLMLASAFFVVVLCYALNIYLGWAVGLAIVSAIFFRLAATVFR